MNNKEYEAHQKAHQIEVAGVNLTLDARMELAELQENGNTQLNINIEDLTGLTFFLIRHKAQMSLSDKENEDFDSYLMTLGEVRRSLLCLRKV